MARPFILSCQVPAGLKYPEQQRLGANPQAFGGCWRRHAWHHRARSPFAVRACGGVLGVRGWSSLQPGASAPHPPPFRSLPSPSARPGMAESEAETPSTPGEFESKYFEYNGVRLPPFCRGKMEEIANFPVRDSDVWIVTYPKSGRRAAVTRGRVPGHSALPPARPYAAGVSAASSWIPVQKRLKVVRGDAVLTARRRQYGRSARWPSKPAANTKDSCRSPFWSEVLSR